MVFYHFREHLPLGPSGLPFFVAGQGYLAVDLFFVLSGFVIQLNYGPSLSRLSASAVRRFAVARFARVYPLHLVVSLIFLVTPIALWVHVGDWDPSDRHDWVYYIASLFLVQNWGFLHRLAWNVPAWSISTEFGAYLLFPPAAYLASRLIRHRATALVWIGGCLLILAVAFWGAGLPSLGSDITTFGLPRCVLEFVAGVGLGRAFLLFGPPGRGTQRALLVLAVAAIAARFSAGVPDYISMPPAFAMLIFAFTARGGIVVRALSARSLIYLGNISYATYLCHFFFKDWVGFLVIQPGVPAWIIWGAYLGVVFIASAVLHKWVELRARSVVIRYADKHWKSRAGSLPKLHSDRVSGGKQDTLKA